MRLYLIPILCLITKIDFAQELGLRYGAAIASDSTLTTPLGAGVYFFSDDSAKKFNLLLSFDVYRTQRQGELPYASVENLRFDYAVAVLGIKSLSRRAKFRIGPTASYQKTKGYIHNMYGSDLKSSFAGIGMILNLKLEEVFRSTVNLDVFLSPEYLFWLDGFNERNPFTTELNFGVSF